MIENTISGDGGASSYVLLLWARELHGRGVRGTVCAWFGGDDYTVHDMRT